MRERRSSRIWRATRTGGPAADADVDRLLTYYQSGKRQEGFEGGIRTAIQAILANPEFVFRFEFPPTKIPAGKRIASRTSNLRRVVVFPLEQRAGRRPAQGGQSEQTTRCG